MGSDHSHSARPEVSMGRGDEIVVPKGPQATCEDTNSKWCLSNLLFYKWIYKLDVNEYCFNSFI